MIAVSCTLISKEYQKDESGNIVVENGKEKYTNVYIEVPIIDVQSVWKNEFYKANEQKSKRNRMSKYSFYKSSRIT